MTPETQKSQTVKIHQLGWILVFAVVYADIGTSIFYVPGILYLSIGKLATLAQLITTLVFISIARKYVEICDRCPDGGGVVSVVRQAFSAWDMLPLVGGALITVDYFLTSAISGVSGMYYLANLLRRSEFFPPVLTEVMGDPKDLVVAMTIVLLLALMVVNLIGIRESASVTSTFAMYEIVAVIALVGMGGWWLTQRHAWGTLVHGVFHPDMQVTPLVLAGGYATTWLAFSGLESAAQLSGAMMAPVKRTASKAMWAVVISVGLMTPFLTALALYAVPDSVKTADPEALLSNLAFQVGGPILGIGVVVAASVLLFMACNTALVGNYHVNVRLADLGFLPSFLRKLHPRLNTPYLSIIASAIIPIVIVIAVNGSVEILGDLYAFGLLGTLTLSSAAVDRLRWRDGERGVKFYIGLLTTFAVGSAFFINIIQKPAALIFGGLLTAFIVGIGYLHRSGALKKAEAAFEKAEDHVADLPEAGDLLTLDEAVEASSVETSKLMVAVHYTNPRVLDEVAVHAKGLKQKNVYVVFVDETPGLFVPLELKPSLQSQRTLVDSCAYLSQKGINGIPVWRLAEDAGYSLAEAAKALRVESVFVGSSKRTFFWRMVKGRMLKRLAELLPEDSNLLVVG